MNDKWIPVSERLPREETPVLILHNRKVKIGEIRREIPSWEEGSSGFNYWDSPESDGQAWEWADVTHWMPLPAAPEESK